MTARKIKSQKVEIELKTVRKWDRQINRPTGATFSCKVYLQPTTTNSHLLNPSQEFRHEKQFHVTFFRQIDKAMAGLTKDELKTALVSHGVEIPLSTLKKDELVGLYDAYVAPHDLGEFSSDDEAVISPQKVTKKVSRTSTNKSTATNGENKSNLTEENSMIVGEIKVDELSDEKLAKYLKDFGIEVGPIVGE